MTHPTAGYDKIAAPYLAHVTSTWPGKAFDEATFHTFAALASGKVLEVGSGPGVTTARLAALGVDISGLDLSPAMVALARQTYPDLHFDEGTMTDIRARDLGGLVSWYSLIHIPPTDRPAVLRGFHQALADDGLLLLAFQAGEGSLHLTDFLGHEIDLTFHRMDPTALAGELGEAGFSVLSTLVRAPDGRERTPQAHILARRA